MKKRQFFSAILTYLFVISVLPIGFIMDKVQAAEISNNYTDYEVSESYICDSAIQEDIAILSTSDGIYTNKDGKMERMNKGKYDFGNYIGRDKEIAYFYNWGNITEFNLTTSNYKFMKLSWDKPSTYVTSVIVDNGGNKWFGVTNELGNKQKEYYLLRMDNDGKKSKSLRLDGFIGNVSSLKCDVNNNIWFRGLYKSNVIAKASFDATNNQITSKTFQLSSSNELLSKFEVNKDGEVFVASYKDGRVWEVLKYREVNGKMVFDKSIDSKTASFTSDSNGELWFLTKGDTSTSNYKVCKLENTGLNKKYDVSNLMKKIKVYNDSNIILTGMNLDNLDKPNGKIIDVYKVISNNKASNNDKVSTEDKVINNPKVGWSSENGKWYYYANNTTIKNNWNKVDNAWYYFDNDGAMSTGWQSIGGKWYYLGDGAMRTGWVSVGGKWYYFNAGGDMASNTTIGGYRLGSDGAWIH